MQKKLSKHFIYKWLTEDLYGEYILHHSNNKFSSRLLLNLWGFLIDTKRSQRSSLILGTKSTRMLDFIAAALRYNLLLSLINTKQGSSQELVIEKKVLRLKNYFNRNLFMYNRSILITSRVKKYLNLSSTFKALFLKSKKSYLNSFNINGFFLNSIKYIWRKSRRTQRARFLPKFNILKATYKNNLRSTNDNFTKSNDLKRISFKINFVKRRSYRLKRFFFTKNKRLYNFKIWRTYIVNTDNSSNNFTFTKNKICLNLKNYILFFSWDSFAYKLKQKVRKIMQTSKAVRKFLLNTAYAKLKFKGTFQKREVVVKKNEITQILNFRLLNYYNVVETPKDLNKILYNNYYKAKILQLPTLASLEFNLVPILLRAGFFENGYITNSLAKRNLFLINGCPAAINTLLNVWDIVSLSKSIWWFVYARYINFLSIFNISTGRGRHLKSTNFIRQFVKIKNLFKKFDYRSRVSTRGSLSKLLHQKNYIFTLPPSYMEVSYKLFIIVIYRLINKSTDIVPAFNRRGLKTILSSSSNRVFS